MEHLPCAQHYDNVCALCLLSSLSYNSLLWGGVFFFKFYIVVYLIYDIVLVSGVQAR